MGYIGGAYFNDRPREEVLLEKKECEKARKKKRMTKTNKKLLSMTKKDLHKEITRLEDIQKGAEITIKARDKTIADLKAQVDERGKRINELIKRIEQVEQYANQKTAEVAEVRKGAKTLFDENARLRQKLLEVLVDWYEDCRAAKELNARLAEAEGGQDKTEAKQKDLTAKATQVIKLLREKGLEVDNNGLVMATRQIATEDYTGAAKTLNAATCMPIEKAKEIVDEVAFAILNK